MSILAFRSVLYDDSPWVRSTEVLEGGRHFLALEAWQAGPDEWREVLRMPINGNHDEDLLDDLTQLAEDTARRLQPVRERLAADNADLWDEYEEQMTSYCAAVALEVWQ